MHSRRRCLRSSARSQGDAWPLRSSRPSWLLRTPAATKLPRAAFKKRSACSSRRTVLGSSSRFSLSASLLNVHCRLLVRRRPSPRKLQRARSSYCVAPMSSLEIWGQADFQRRVTTFHADALERLVLLWTPMRLLSRQLQHLLLWVYRMKTIIRVQRRILAGHCAICRRRWLA